MSKDKNLNVPSQSEDIVSVEELKNVLGTGDGLNGGSGSDDGSGSGSDPVSPEYCHATANVSGSISYGGITWTASGMLTCYAKVTVKSVILREYKIEVVSVSSAPLLKADSSTTTIDGKQVTLNGLNITGSFGTTPLQSIGDGEISVRITRSGVLFQILRSYTDENGISHSLDPDTVTKTVSILFNVSYDVYSKTISIGSPTISA